MLFRRIVGVFGNQLGDCCLQTGGSKSIGKSQDRENHLINSHGFRTKISAEKNTKQESDDSTQYACKGKEEGSFYQWMIHITGDTCCATFFQGILPHHVSEHGYAYSFYQYMDEVKLTCMKFVMMRY